MLLDAERSQITFRLRDVHHEFLILNIDRAIPAKSLLINLLLADFNMDG